ncbi:hypothetical protein H4Q26_014468 [Puccinia striiformis f. sp. tritici PST-130]|nr:hypothetical protein H4Q26_014468 [Puccinia striiformis f. sp. tritici PST-130]
MYLGKHPSSASVPLSQPWAAHHHLAPTKRPDTSIKTGPGPKTKLHSFATVTPDQLLRVRADGASLLSQSGVPRQHTYIRGNLKACQVSNSRYPLSTRLNSPVTLKYLLTSDSGRIHLK